MAISIPVITTSTRFMRSALVVLMSAAAAPSVFADVPRLIHYQGLLRQAGGFPVNGAVSVRFRLYDHSTHAAPVLFDETHAGVAVAEGLFNVFIGAQTAGGVPDSALNTPSPYLGISVNGEAELTPRVEVSSTPHAIKARSAEQLVRPGTFQPALASDEGGALAVSGQTGSNSQVLTSRGPGTPPTWQSQSGGAVAMEAFLVDTNAGGEASFSLSQTPSPRLVMVQTQAPDRFVANVSVSGDVVSFKIVKTQYDKATSANTTIADLPSGVSIASTLSSTGTPDQSPSSGYAASNMIYDTPPSHSHPVPFLYRHSHDINSTVTELPPAGNESAIWVICVYSP